MAAVRAEPPVTSAKPPVTSAKPPVTSAKPPVTSAKPPVTSQEDWESELLPWIRRVEAALQIQDCSMDVDRVHLMTAVVARDVQRSMAPISSFLVGYAMGRGAGLEEACQIVEQVTTDVAA